MITEQEIKDGLLKVKSIYGKAYAQRLEQLYRNETAHFKSGNFQITHAPGMEAFADTLPYGWTQLSEYWIINPQYAPTHLHSQVENTSALSKASEKPKRFLVFENMEASMMSVAYLIKLRSSNFGTWFSKNPTQIANYNKVLDTIKPRFIV